jgi:cellulase/cellobiase CelA1
MVSTACESRRVLPKAKLKKGKTSMIKKVFAVLLLSLAAAACESTETKEATPSPAAQVSPTPAPSPSVESSPAAAVAWKAGDKVKVTINGSAVAATIVSVDEKAAKATVKVGGETRERTVNLSDIAKQ